MQKIIITDDTTADVTEWYCEHNDLETDMEDALYVLFELTPSDDNWFDRLTTTGQCFFDYHGIYYNVTMCYGPNNTVNLIVSEA